MAGPREYRDAIEDLLEIRLIRHSSHILRDFVDGIDELIGSIKINGLLQPITVRPRAHCFEIVTGNRRFEACRRLKWITIPAIIKDMDDKEAFEAALTENIHRKTLTPVEEALAFKAYVEKFGYGGISDLSKRICKSEVYISHRIKLLSLPRDILRLVTNGELSVSQAKELIWVDEKKQVEVAELIHEYKLPVRDVREYVRFTKRSASRSDKLQTTHKSRIPDFELSDRDEADRQRIRQKTYGKVVLLLRVALIRLDSILENAPAETKEHLFNVRHHLHAMIDEALPLKIASRRDETRINPVYVDKVFPRTSST